MSTCKNANTHVNVQERQVCQARLPSPQKACNKLLSIAKNSDNNCQQRQVNIQISQINLTNLASSIDYVMTTSKNATSTRNFLQTARKNLESSLNNCNGDHQEHQVNPLCFPNQFQITSSQPSTIICQPTRMPSPPPNDARQVSLIYSQPAVIAKSSFKNTMSSLNCLCQPWAILNQPWIILFEAAKIASPTSIVSRRLWISWRQPWLIAKPIYKSANLPFNPVKLILKNVKATANNFLFNPKGRQVRCPSPPDTPQ